MMNAPASHQEPSSHDITPQGIKYTAAHIKWNQGPIMRFRAKMPAWTAQIPMISPRAAASQIRINGSCI